ncbi:hypothetical protein PENOC_103350 [Penicillium occitanis (nom. inval.)]|nr:hypothetical protein PENOC_103350 [Penicillium occitanis (nom. inval.)]
MNHPSRDVSNSSRAAGSTSEATGQPNDYSHLNLSLAQHIPAISGISSLPPYVGLRSASEAASHTIQIDVRVLKTSRPGRRAKAKTLDIILPAPLSRLTGNSQVPIKDMEAWVGRSADVRRQEAQKKGKIARPMNSFMIYRSAYADRVKEWCARNDHKIVSQISGLSWSREPPEIRAVYELLASVEKENHHNAHPDYKFAPKKPRAHSRKKRCNNNGSGVDDAGYRLGFTTSREPGKLTNGEFDGLESTQYDDDPLFPASHLARPLPSRFMTPGATHAASRPISHVMNNGYSTSTGLARGCMDQESPCPYGSSSAVSIYAAVNYMYDGHLDPPLLDSHQAGFDMRSYSHAKLSTVQPCPDQSPETYMSMTAPTGNNWGYDPLSTSYILQPLERL